MREGVGTGGQLPDNAVEVIGREADIQGDTLQGEGSMQTAFDEPENPLDAGAVRFCHFAPGSDYAMLRRDSKLGHAHVLSGV